MLNPSPAADVNKEVLINPSDLFFNFIYGTFQIPLGISPAIRGVFETVFCFVHTFRVFSFGLDGASARATVSVGYSGGCREMG